MLKFYRQAILRWEKELASHDPYRFTRPFEWGWEWLRVGPIQGLPAQIPDSVPANIQLQILKQWNQRVLAGSDAFFSYQRVQDYRLDTIAGQRERVLRFTSAVPTPYPENNTVHARWYPANRGRAVIVLPQWNSDAEGHLGLCRIFQKFGIASLRLSMPYHDDRRPAHLQRAEYTVDSNIGRTIQAARQAVIDIRACLDWLELQGYESLGIVGTSLGSCYAFLAAAHESRLRVNAFNHVSPYFGDVVWTGMSTRHVRAGLETHLDQDGLREAWRVISPASYLPKMQGANKRNLLIWARYDPSFLPEFSREVLRSFRELRLDHQVRALPCGHYTTGQAPFKYMDAYHLTRFLARNL